MIYERANGGGKIFGMEVFVCADSYVDRESFTAGNANIWNSEIRQSKVVGDSRIRNSKVEDFSEIGASRLPVEIVQSHVIHSKLTGGSITGALVVDSRITGLAQVRGNNEGAKIIGSTLKGRVIVEGSAIVKGIILEKRMRIVNGVWLKPPRYFEFDNEVAQIGVTESVNGEAMVGCRNHKMTDFIKKRKLYMNVMKWPEEMITTIKHRMESWLDVPV